MLLCNLLKMRMMDMNNFHEIQQLTIIKDASCPIFFYQHQVIRHLHSC